MRSCFRGGSLLALVVASSLGCGGNKDTALIPIDGSTDGASTGSDGATGDGGGGDGTSTGGGDDSSIALATYTITPGNAVVKIDLATGTAGTQAFTVSRTNPDGSSTDVTSSSTFSLDDPSLGAFAKNVFTSGTSLPTGVLGKTTIVHALPGTGAANLTVVALRTSGASRDFFFTVPYKKDPDPKQDTLHFGTNIQQVDVAFLLDTTASMSPEIGNLGDSLADSTAGILVKLTGAIPSVGLALAHFQDFPVDPVGTGPGHSALASTPYVLDYTVQTGTLGLSNIRSQVYSLQAATGGGGYLSEGQYDAQYQLLTGAGYSWTIDPSKLLTTCGGGSCAGSSGSIAAHTPRYTATPSGVDFRPGALPIVVQITDAGWMTTDQYKANTGNQLAPATRDQVAAAYNSVKAKFVGVQAVWPDPSTGKLSTDATCIDPTNVRYLMTDSTLASKACDSYKGYSQAIDMAVATGSFLDPVAFNSSSATCKSSTDCSGATPVCDTAAGFCRPCSVGQCCTGIGGADVAPYASASSADPANGKCPLVFQAKTDGTGVANGVVAAIQAISVGAAFDVTAVASNDPTNAPDSTGAPVDATKFIQSIEALGAGTPDGSCAKLATKDTNGDGIQDTFINVNVHTPVCFIVHAATNTTVPPTKKPQFFNAFIDVLGMPGSVKLDRRAVIFLVPPADLTVK